MPVAEIGDPRLQALFGANDPRDAGVRPTLRLPRKGLPPALMVGAAVLLAVLLFAVLNARRTAQPVPTVRSTAQDGATAWESAPPLYVPPVPQPEPLLMPSPVKEAPLPQAPVPKAAIPLATRPPVVQAYVPPPVSQIAPVSAPPQPRVSSGSALVIDTSGGAAGSPTTAAGLTPGQQSAQGPIRVRASSFANRATTIPQGNLIPAVLETGFNSTQPGFARAIVSRDVRSFDGANILIPRGSRLIGEYQVATDKTQKRATIIWTRLIRPDGMTIAMDSPAVDTLGRGGVPASVNTHFLQRFGDALLQSTVDIGRAFAGRAVTGPVVVLPGATAPATTSLTSPSSYVPTLTVPPGKSISVFVAHDLDFSSVGSRQ